MRIRFQIRESKFDSKNCISVRDLRLSVRDRVAPAALRCAALAYRYVTVCARVLFFLARAAGVTAPLTVFLSFWVIVPGMPTHIYLFFVQFSLFYTYFVFLFVMFVRMVLRRCSFEHGNPLVGLQTKEAALGCVFLCTSVPKNVWA
jgi:hypothetical protein